MPTETDRAKVKAFDEMMAANAAKERADKRRASLETMARVPGETGVEAKRLLAEIDKAAATNRQAKARAALPGSIEAAGGDAKAYSKADMLRRAGSATGDAEPSGDAGLSQASMRTELAKKGLKPVGG